MTCDEMKVRHVHRYSTNVHIVAHLTTYNGCLGLAQYCHGGSDFVARLVVFSIGVVISGLKELASAMEEAGLENDFV